AELLREALAVARSLEDSWARMQALAALAPHLPVELGAEVLSEALAAVRSFGPAHNIHAKTIAFDRIDNRGYALAGLAPHLMALAPHLPVELRAEMLSEALAADWPLQVRWARAQVLEALVLHLPAELVREALTAVRSLKSSFDRADALA